VSFEHEGALGARAERLTASRLFEPGSQTERVAIVRGAASPATEWAHDDGVGGERRAP
jgi:hypothetical protein